MYGLKRWVRYIFPLIILVVLNRSFGKSLSVITFGPMLHYYFGDTKNKWSFGIEVAYWSIEEHLRLPFSVDLGFEFSKEKAIIYSELQTGIVFLGASFGVCMESFDKGIKNKYGFQGSIWTNFILGMDYRIRFTEQKKSNGLGTYFKVAPNANLNF